MGAAEPGGRKKTVGEPQEPSHQEEFTRDIDRWHKDPAAAGSGLLDMLGVPSERRTDEVFLTAMTVMTALQMIIGFGKSPTIKVQQAGSGQRI